MLFFSNVTSWMAPLLGANSWINGFGQVLPPQREFFYVGGEYQSLSVSHAKLTTELFPPSYMYHFLKECTAFYSDLLQNQMPYINSGRSLLRGQASLLFLNSQ